MAITYTGSTVEKPIKELQGLSTDTKPTELLGTGSTLWEIDTKKGWIFDEKNINPITSNGWWEI